jgi:hypothetical protein
MELEFARSPGFLYALVSWARLRKPLKGRKMWVTSHNLYCRKVSLTVCGEELHGSGVD